MLPNQESVVAAVRASLAPRPPRPHPHFVGPRASNVRQARLPRAAQAEGGETMFGNPGTTDLPLMDALAVDNEMHYVLALQEAAVMAMADGYAQASGKLAVVNLHVAPGLGNAMGMLYDAT